jgi:hypothetical protein
MMILFVKDKSQAYGNAPRSAVKARNASPSGLPPPAS